MRDKCLWYRGAPVVYAVAWLTGVYLEAGGGGDTRHCVRQRVVVQQVGGVHIKNGGVDQSGQGRMGGCGWNKTGRDMYKSWTGPGAQLRHPLVAHLLGMFEKVILSPAKMSTDRTAVGLFPVLSSHSTVSWYCGSVPKLKVAPFVYTPNSAKKIIQFQISWWAREQYITRMCLYWWLSDTDDEKGRWLTGGDGVLENPERRAGRIGGENVAVESVVVCVRHRQRVDQPVRRLLFAHRDGRRQTRELGRLQEEKAVHMTSFPVTIGE